MTIIKGNVATPKGFTAGGVHCGIRKTKLDLGWVYSEVPAVTAGVYTLNSFQAAPLKVTQESVASNGMIQGLLVNSGVANACTGSQGLKDAYQMRDLFAKKFGLTETDVAIASTGVIGEMLPMSNIESGIQMIDPETTQHEAFAEAILTTDTKVKEIAVQLEVDGETITIGGAAKGSGMINPNMATMLGFVTTDAAIEPAALNGLIKDLTNQSFNMITVDGDTSTNDMVMVMANGLQKNQPLNHTHEAWETFKSALGFVFETLAKEIARDGEGATKLIEVSVTGAVSVESAQKIGKAVISSNLVKTAIHGADANWGRIVTAVGYSGEPIDPDEVSVKLGNILVVEKGVPAPFSEEEAKDYLEKDEVLIDVTVGETSHQATGYGCDLSYEYVRINASYRT